MPDVTAAAEGDAGEAEDGAVGAEPSPRELDRLAAAVYRLLRDDLGLQRERRGAALDRWR